MRGSSQTIVQSYFTRLREGQYREVLTTAAVVVVGLPAVLLWPGAAQMSNGLAASASSTTVVLFALIVTLGAAVKGMSGFGYALIVTPIAASVIDPTIAVIVLAIPAWMLNVFQVGETRIGWDYIRHNWVLITLSVIGAAIGVFVLSSFHTGPIIPFIIGLVLLGYVVFQVLRRFVVIKQARHPLGLGVIGLLEGFFLGSANLGPLLPAYLHAFERDANRYIGGLSMIFAFVFSERIVQMLATGLLTPYRLWLGSVIALFTLLGLAIGTALRRLGINREMFNWLVIGILFVIALNILRKTGPAILQSF